jgi:hypothetical protein
MARRFVSRFLLPLVAGGRIAIERPLSRRTVEALARAAGTSGDPAETQAAARLSAARHDRLASLVGRAPVAPLDEPTWRIGGAVHNLLALTHPAIAGGVGADARLTRVAAEAADLAALGPPVTLTSVLERHSLLARLPEVVRVDSTVHYWLGHKTFVGRSPPGRILALPSVRGVRVETARRSWLREVGVPAEARPAFLALIQASPLGEALDPLRLDPPPSWSRLLSVLRFPPIARLAAGRMLDLGVGRCGDALAEALYRFVSLQDEVPAGGAWPSGLSPEAVAFALQFLAHLVWLEVMFGGDARRDAGASPADGPPEGDLDRARDPSGNLGNLGRTMVDAPGRELAVLLAAVNLRAPAQLRPRDVPATSDLGRAFARQLEAWFARHDVERSPRWPTALDVAGFAATSASGHAGAGRLATPPPPDLLPSPGS